MSVRLLTEHHLELLGLTGGYRGSSESTHVKMSHCWKSHVLAQLLYSSSLSYFCPSLTFSEITLHYIGLKSTMNDL